MNPDDYAIVVGIRRYPGFGRTETEARDLEGPDNDAEAICGWLTAPDKGGVPIASARLIRSKDFPDPFPNALVAEPQKQAILAAFDRLESIAQQHDSQGQGLRVGRRLYLYMSGHGFAPRRKQAALFTANATRVRTSHHVHASDWMEWFYNAEYFDELVLWIDCCMTFDLSVMPERGGYRILQGTTGTGKMFTAYAAKPPLQAVERRMADGLMHGVFTYALLKGLEGAAADQDTFEVTSSSLREYLTNAMKTFLTEQDLQDSSVSKEPDFGADDPMVFLRVAHLLEFPMQLSFGAAAEGMPVRIVTGSPLRQAARGIIHHGRFDVALPRAVYFAMVEGLGWIKDFEVTGGQDSVVTVGV